MDVCALFHRADELGRFLHPNKIYQYLASGKPVVSTAFLPELDGFGDLVRVAGSPSRFIDAVEAALSEGGRSGEIARRSRVEFARLARPEVRAEEKVRRIDRLLARTPSRGVGSGRSLGGPPRLEVAEAEAEAGTGSGS